VQLPVPRDKQAALGCKTLERSLRTRDESEAHRLRHRVIAELQDRISGAVPTLSPELTPEAILKIAHKAREAVEAGDVRRQDAEDGLAAAVDDYLGAQASLRGTDHQGHPVLPAGAVVTLRRAHGVLAGNEALTLRHQVERYMAQVNASTLRRQTVANKQRHLDDFLAWIGPDTETLEVTKAKAGEYVDDVISARKVTAPTKRTMVNTLRQFFDWLEARDLVRRNPFDKMTKLLKDSTRGKEQARRSWQPEEFLMVLNKIPEGDAMWPMAVLCAYTGARREDICALRAEDVEGDVLNIREGKTASALRRVPVHPVIRPLVRHLVEATSDGYLLPGLLTGGADNQRGHYIGKRFGYLIRERLKIKDKRFVMHGFRNTVLSQMEVAEVSLLIRQQIVGHVAGTVTERDYTGKATDVRKAEAIANVTYGPEVDALVETSTGRFAITKRSRRRKTAS
jgi:integrase